MEEGVAKEVTVCVSSHLHTGTETQEKGWQLVPSQEGDRVPLGLGPSPGALPLINLCVNLASACSLPLSPPFLLPEVSQTKASEPFCFRSLVDERLQLILLP